MSALSSLQTVTIPAAVPFALVMTGNAAAAADPGEILPVA